VVFPRPELEGALAKLSNALLGWVIARWGDPVDFTDAPDFERRYLVSSPEPDRTRRFLDDGRLRRLADTRLLNIHAGGDMLTVARIDPTATSVTLETVTARVDEALAIFAVMRTGRSQPPGGGPVMV